MCVSERVVFNPYAPRRQLIPLLLRAHKHGSLPDSRSQPGQPCFLSPARNTNVPCLGFTARRKKGNKKNVRREHTRG